MIVFSQVNSPIEVALASPAEVLRVQVKLLAHEEDTIGKPPEHYSSQR